MSKAWVCSKGKPTEKRCHQLPETKAEPGFESGTRRIGSGKPFAMDWAEKRKHPRFKAADNALAAVGEDPYTLMDLSAGGFGVRYYGDHPVPEEIHMDLFFLNREFTLSGVRCRKVFEKTYGLDRPDGVPEWHVGLQIIDPTTRIIEELRQFRWTQNDPDGTKHPETGKVALKGNKSRQ